VHKNIATLYGANLFCARLAGHGLKDSDTTMKSLTADQLIQSAEQALQIAQQLGDSVHIISTSFGAALSLHLAGKFPTIINSLVMYSPCIKVYDDNAELLDNPWGLEIATLVTGSQVRNLTPTNDLHKKYWSMQYHMNGAVAMQNFLTNAMVNKEFAKVKCPTFLGYWYKNEAEQDKVVSVPAMLKMYEHLGTQQALKTKMAFPNAGNHVLASYVLSKDLSGVEAATKKFYKEIVKL
jgi:esterase/lipase